METAKFGHDIGINIVAFAMPLDQPEEKSKRAIDKMCEL
jgi:hypothetical protein